MRISILFFFIAHHMKKCLSLERYCQSILSTEPLEPPRGKMLATLGERAFQAAAPHLWNELPLQLRTIGSVETFKNSIKTFLFGQSF